MNILTPLMNRMNAPHPPGPRLKGGETEWIVRCANENQKTVCYRG